jgi:hypothetical protein
LKTPKRETRENTFKLEENSIILTGKQLQKNPSVRAKNEMLTVSCSNYPRILAIIAKNSPLFIISIEMAGNTSTHKRSVRKPIFVQHVIMRNDFYIFVGFPHEWRNEMKLTDGINTVVCDAWFKANGKYNILEVDHCQTMKENRNKIEKYRGLFEAGAMEKHFGYFPMLIWLTTTKLRKKKLTELCKGLPYFIYTVDDIK